MSAPQILGACCLLLALPAFAGEPETPVQKQPLTYEQGEDRAAFIALVMKARQGDAEAQWLAGSTYLRLGDPARALPMLQSAAGAAHPRAAALLGSLHEDGAGTAQNSEQALRWYRLAAEHGQPEGMAALGRLLLAQGGQEAREAAWKWLRQAASLGDRDAQYQLGWLLAQPGTGNDDVQSYQWFARAADQGHVGAQIAAASQLLAGKGVGRDHAAAASRLEPAAATQDPVANYLLGRLREAEGPQASESARGAWRVAAAAGHREARFALAAMLARSTTADDRKEAVEWFAKADQDGHRAAANRLGEAYRDGTGVAQDFHKAINYFNKAAAQGHAQGMYNLARMQNDGLGGPQDTRQALEWYARAAEQGHEGAAAVMDALLKSSVQTSALGIKGFWQ